MTLRRVCLIWCLAVGNFVGSARATESEEKKPANTPIGAFVPHAGYLRNVKTMQLMRRAQNGIAIPLAPGTPLAIQGTRSIPVICVEFNNVTAPFDAAKYQEMLFGSGQYTMTSYYENASHGRFHVKGNAFGWYKAPKDDSYYEGANNGLGGPRFGELLQFAFQKADQTVDFGQFDNDGPDGQPNSGDDDGVVDTIFVIHPEIGAECGVSGQLKNIWSHSWHYSEDLGHSGPFITNDPVKNSSGQPVPGAFIKIDDYTIQPGQACSSNAMSKQMIQVGVFCHEYGHALGLPDLYDRTPQGGADSEGIGNYCLMAGGSYGGDGNHADRPCEMSAWSKYYLGWSNAKSLAATLLKMEPVDLANRIYRFDVPGTSKLEYFLIEYRRKKGWDEFIPASGLAIWHVDERVGQQSAAWPFSAPDEGQNDSPNAVGTLPALFGNEHQMVALVQADRKMDLEKNVNRGDGGDLFAAGDFKDDTTGVAGSRAYSGDATQLVVKNITVLPDEVQIKVELPAAVPAAPPAQHSLGDVAINSTPTAIENQAFALQLHDKIGQGAATFSGADRRQLRSIPNHVWSALPDDKSKADILHAASQARTTTVSKDTQPSSDVEKAVKSRVVQDANQPSVDFQLNASQTSVERIGNLSIPLGSQSPAADAQARVSNTWKDLFGNAQLALVNDTFVKGDQTQTFRQLTAVGSKTLPVFGREVAVHYADKELKGITANLVESQVKVNENAAELSVEQGKSIVSQALSIPQSTIKDAKQGIYLIHDDPQLGRQAVQCKVSVGPNQRDIEVYVDAESQRILEIK